MAPEPTAMTPTQAAAALADIGTAEETLTANATGLTNMIWGVVAAAIFLAYGTADDLDAFPALAYVLWAPFVAAGMLITNRLWATNAIVLRRGSSSRPWISLAFTAGFTAVAVALILGLPEVGVEWSTHAIMLLMNGLLAAVMGVMAKQLWCTCGGPQTTGAGVLMILGGVALGFASWSEQATALTAACAALAAWAGSGYLIARRG